MAKRDAIAEKIQRLQQLAEDGDDVSLSAELKHVLSLKNNFVIAKAADIIAQRLCYDFIPQLLGAWTYFSENPLKRDKTCAAKRAIARALYALDYDDTAFYSAGIRYRQLEPVWMDHVDTAVELRCTCAYGLAAGSYPRVAVELIGLLYDKEVQVRMGGAKALETIRPFEAELALRQKILGGDSEPEVLGQCMLSLLRVAPEYGPEFVQTYLSHPQTEVGQAAAMALGECRLEAAMQILIAHCAQSFPQPQHAVLYRAIALHRRAQAIDFLLRQVAENSSANAIAAIKALSIYHYQDDLTARLCAMLEQAGPALKKAFKEIWSEAQGR